MRLAILSDIHGNLVALETVLRGLAQLSIEQYLCLGDVASSGPQPHAVLERLMALHCPVVQGNADEWLISPIHYTGDDLFYRRIDEIDSWCEAQLTEQDKAFLHTFMPVIEVSLGDGLQLLAFHGSPRSNQEIILATTPDQQLNELFGSLEQPVFIGGHTHQQMLRRYRDRLVLNPGSVGLAYERSRPDGAARNVPWAEYALLTWQAGNLHIEFCRVPLDLEAVKQAALESGMPHAEWWASNWHD